MIRRASKSDRDSWIKLNREFMAFEVQDEKLWNDISKVDNDILGLVFDDAINNPSHITIFMIEVDGNIIGFANLMSIFSVWAKGFALIIDDLYIAEEYRACGHGRQVMKEIEDFAHNRQYRRIQFQSEKTNPGARAFYEKLGYEPTEMDFYVRYL